MDRSAPQADLINRLKPIIRGWSNYYSNACSKAVFSTMDNLVYHTRRLWLRRPHPNKNRHWIAHKYWLFGEGKGWVFATKSIKIQFDSTTMHIRLSNAMSRCRRIGVPMMAIGFTGVAQWVPFQWLTQELHNF